MKIVNGNLAYPAQRCLAAAFLLALTGCVSAVSEDKDASADVKPAIATAQVQATPEQQKQAAAQAQNGGHVDPAMISASSARAQPQRVAASQTTAHGSPQPYGQAPQITGLATQPTGISANSLSIYANSENTAVPANGSVTGSVPAYAPGPKIVPALNSVYSSPTPVQPSSTAPTPEPQQHSASSVTPPVDAAAPKLASQVQPANETVPVDGKSVPIAAFFAGAAKKRSNGLTQVAALPSKASAQLSAGISLAGRRTMTDEFDDTHGDEDDSKPAGLMKLASLSGLSRVAPNGLLVQTEQVNVGCFKPELIRRIKEVEAHYQRPATVTSGYRPPKATTQGSKHYTCDAADIQVSGVTKWELSNYLRSLPDRGGVGTYCHTESVHMDIGEPRDWNWRCRRTAQNL
ncbi:D-Ala-D-Ala carboxypeptidase family metallohydrolase [Agrobacterium sp. rho-13.3]|uniref:YcbK family protein n=1 Tax=Agrobacterium sp. rho-13.3 TaxID=3072980 RepID=UPI002A15C5D5|nr:D-Ala-D-Ala carboxypeptidase family metallohydrolase [Agrobacterium sp. rho-13.3]MDX8311248.1 D-Ala-D-Ala carboxypeptidase family metallohydrolase [Agrobacterium sp. rho-13.3]